MLRLALAIVVAAVLAADTPPAPVGPPLPPRTTSIVSAETMEVPAQGGGVVSSSGAATGRVLKLWSEATASAKVSTAAADGIVVRARGEPCGGAPHLSVSLDGRRVLDVDVSARTWTHYRARAVVARREHTLEVEYTNDYESRRCDRNLLVDEIAFVTSRWPPLPPRPTGPTDHVLFDADLARRALSAYLTVWHPERIAIIDDPVLGPRRKVAKLTVYDGDVGPTEDPRAQLETPRILTEGREVWIGWSTLFPEGWPSSLPCDGGKSWLTFEEVYGPPYGDGGPRHLGMRACSGVMNWQRNDFNGFDVPWQHPIPTNRWVDFVVHQKMSRDPAVGFVELYVNTGQGWRQQPLGGRNRLYMTTMDSTNGAGPNNHRLSLYRRRGMFPVLTIFHADHKIGTSFAAVAPKSYG